MQAINNAITVSRSSSWIRQSVLLAIAASAVLAMSACSSSPVAVTSASTAAADTEPPRSAEPSTPSAEPSLTTGGFSSKNVKVVPGPKVSQDWATAASLNDLKRLDEEMYAANGMSCYDLNGAGFTVGGEFALAYTFLSDAAAQEVAAESGDCQLLDEAQDIVQFKVVNYASNEDLLEWSGKSIDGTALPDDQLVTCTQTVLADYPDAVGTLFEGLYDKTICVLNFDVWSVWASMPNGSDLKARMQELGDLTAAFAEHHDATAGYFE